MIHKADGGWRTYYGNGWSVHFFPWGIQVRRRLAPKDWRSLRVAVGVRHPRRSGTRLIDFSTRRQKTAQGKPIEPCWRFWIGVKIGRTPSPHYDEAGA